MERYHSYGRKSNPEFPYRVWVKDTTDAMMHWCSTYPAAGSFERYYIDWPGSIESEYVVFQFETERPAILFQLKFGDQ